MARVHGIHRKRRRVSNNTRQNTSEDDRYDGDSGERFDLGGCLRREPNPTVKCARVTRELLLRCLWLVLHAHNAQVFAAAHFWTSGLAFACEHR